MAQETVEKIDRDTVNFIEPEVIQPPIEDYGLTKPTLDGGLSIRKPRNRIIPITVGTSPYTYQNKSNSNMQIVITGGTSVTLKVSPNNITADKVDIAGTPFTLRPGDFIHITHSGAPTAYGIIM